MLRFYAYASALLLGTVTSCAPTYELAVKPAQPTGLFIEGREQARSFADDSVEVRLSFVRYEPTRLVFEAEYRNKGKQAVTIAPADFSCRPARYELPARPAGAPRLRPTRGTAVSASVAAASARRTLPALPTEVKADDPEQEISSMRKLADQEAARANRFDWVGLALTAASFGADVASIGKRETHAQYQNRALLQQTALIYNVSAASARVGHAVLAEELRYRTGSLEQYALRKTTLQPGQQVYGLVYFPRVDSADDLLLQAPGPVAPVTLPFRQTHTRDK